MRRKILILIGSIVVSLALISVGFGKWYEEVTITGNIEVEPDQKVIKEMEDELASLENQLKKLEEQKEEPEEEVEVKEEEIEKDYKEETIEDEDVDVDVDVDSNIEGESDTVVDEVIEDNTND